MCKLFHYKDRSIIFLICALLVVIFGREFSLSTLTFHFFIYSFVWGKAKEQNPLLNQIQKKNAKTKSITSLKHMISLFPCTREDNFSFQASYGAKITQELCPPKPKELLIAAVTLCSFLTLAHVSIPVTTSSHSF